MERRQIIAQVFGDHAVVGAQGLQCRRQQLGVDGQNFDGSLHHFDGRQVHVAFVGGLREQVADAGLYALGGVAAES